MNLLKETLEILAKNNKTPKDVLWIGSKDGYSTWENFERLADTIYSSGYGSIEVAEDLVIVGKDWWLERGEYDGSEWWEFKRKPKQPKTLRRINKLFLEKFESSLAELNDWVEKDD